jgi:hypothetical protein
MPSKSFFFTIPIEVGATQEDTDSEHQKNKKNLRPPCTLKPGILWSTTGNHLIKAENRQQNVP